MYIFSMV